LKIREKLKGLFQCGFYIGKLVAICCVILEHCIAPKVLINIRKLVEIGIFFLCTNMLMPTVIFFEDVISYTNGIYFQNATNVLFIAIKFWIHIFNGSSGQNTVIIFANIIPIL